MSDIPPTHAPSDSGVPAHARDFGVKDRVIIVTGAGQGIGREYVRQFAAAGAIAIVADLNADNAKSVCREIEAAGGKAMPLRVDVADVASVEAMAADVLAARGRIDALINNAGIFAALHKLPFDEIPLDQWDLVIRVNITGTYLPARAVAPAMRKARWGRIINISSDSVPRGAVNYLHYVTSKSALIGMTNAMARELGEFGVTVNCIRPGGVATEVERVHNPTSSVRERLASQQCIPRGMLPEDLVGMVMFLCTPAAGFVTGQTIAVDGGYTHSS